MKANLKHILFNPLIITGLLLFLLCAVVQQSYLLILTAAQLILIPVMLLLIGKLTAWETGLSMLSMLSVFLLYLSLPPMAEVLFSFIYLLFTIMVAWKGVRRFFQRGFTNWGEIAIDTGMVYLFVGGIWFFAYTTGINTGFSSLLTWLTAIHFHYSAFLFPVFLGYFGRIHSSSLYSVVVPLVLAGPLLVAAGITFWPLLEFLSSIIYILAIYCIAFLVWRTRFPSKFQAVLIRTSFTSLCITILFSLAYAASSAFQLFSVSIGTMMIFHGLLNCVGFGVLGVIGWVLLPPAGSKKFTFPVSKIRGKLLVTEGPASGLVDDMSLFVKEKNLPQTIIDFYEKTPNYHLRASVKWAVWFYPFALLYKMISKRTQQINLPLSSDPVVMTGELLAVNAETDGRVKPRAWVRKVNDETVFTAIYSYHEAEGQILMNIALPLPWSTMTGILRLHSENGALILSSTGEGDAGIYLAAGTSLFQLPLSEKFVIQEVKPGTLSALHMMKILGLVFLRVNYSISHIEQKQIERVPS
ncbi:hypothetical protein GJU40_16770 [Bacillus lacus]|uniref:YndJ-like protein n=1 Tax=Metabacillus lacus TaxID=1983721 RepID=A0A7X2J2A1_9BACI|nr:YndJ family protein [Metabacillus lacus]MRX73797.1 hypothetical protein [Metabacillus lacus]